MGLHYKDETPRRRGSWALSAEASDRPGAWLICRGRALARLLNRRRDWDQGPKSECKQEERLVNPSFRTEQADAFSCAFAPANVSACAERNLSAPVLWCCELSSGVRGDDRG